MNKPTLKDLVSLLVICAVPFGMMQLLIYFFGELHGIISTVVLLMVQMSLLSMRIWILERQLKNVRRDECPETVQKAV